MGFPDSSCLQCRRPWFNSWVRKIPWGRDGLPTPVFLGFPWGSAGKESSCSVGDLGSVPGLGRSPEKGKATHSSYSTIKINLATCNNANESSKKGLKQITEEYVWSHFKINRKSNLKNMLL